VKLLLDTHAFLWAIGDPGRLSPNSRNAIEDARNDLLLSLASVWEIAVKSGLGKLTIPKPAVPFVQRQVVLHRMAMLNIQVAHLAAVERIPAHHRDPFDRMLVAQALEERIPLISGDRQLRKYGLQIIW